MNADSAPSFPERSVFANHHIERFLWTTPDGELYEVVLGSTMHEYGLLVLRPDIGIDLAGLQAVVAPLRATTDPCLAKPFACGESAGRLWIRMELTESVALSRLTGARPGKGQSEEDGPRVEDGQDLREAFGGAVPQDVLWPVLGDLIEGMLAVHRAGGRLGDVGLRDIGFEATVRHNGTPVVSKWCNYGLLALRDPARAAAWTETDDVRAFIALARTLLCGAPDAAPPSGVWREWGAVFALADAPAPTSKDLATAYTAVLAAHRLSRAMRIRPEDTIPAAGRGDSAPQRSRSRASSAPPPRRAPPRSYQRDASGKVRGGGRLAMLVLAVFAGIGIVVAAAFPFFKSLFVPSATPQTARTSQATPEADGNAPETDPSVTSEDASAALEPGQVWWLSRGQLEAYAAQTSRADTLPARMRLAFLLAEGNDDNAPDPDRAASLAAPAFEAMQSRTAGIDLALDRACDFWMGYALVAGIGVEPDPARGALLLERCAETHRDPRGMALLGDYYASGAESGVSAENDRTASALWLDAVRLQPEGRWPAYAVDCARKTAGLFFAGRGIPDREQDRYIAGIELAANHGDLASMLALGHAYLDGRAVNANPATARQWFSRASQRGDPFGMYHMARMIELGLASQADIGAATLWYRRAAKRGSASAMHSIARLLRDGRIPDSTGEPLKVDDGRTADEWDAAADALPPSEPLPRTTWWLGAQGTRFPAPEPSRLR